MGLERQLSGASRAERQEVVERYALLFVGRCLRSEFTPCEHEKAFSHGSRKAPSVARAESLRWARPAVAPLGKYRKALGGKLVEDKAKAASAHPNLAIGVEALEVEADKGLAGQLTQFEAAARLG